jgi:flagellar assembly factor FliW
VIIQTSRFGQVPIQESDILMFPEGLLGFADLRKFVLLDDPSDEIFAWLQSCEASPIAFPVLDPEMFLENYKITLTKADLESLRVQAGQSPKHLCIITIPDDPTQMTANLKAPIIVNIQEKLARQCVLQDNHLAIREPIFMKLQERVVRNPNSTIKEQTSIVDVAVRLNIPDSGRPVEV